MNTPQQTKASLHYRLIQKLDPSQFPRMSGVMAALVGFVLDTPRRGHRREPFPGQLR